MAETFEQLDKQIDEVHQEIKRLDAKFLGNVGDPTKAQENKRTFENIMCLYDKQWDLFKKLARLYHPEL